jgi:hypothetical protein
LRAAGAEVDMRAPRFAYPISTDERFPGRRVAV